MTKKLIIILILAVSAFSSFAQHTLTYTQKDKLFYDGKEMYDQRKYAASYRLFEEYLKTAKPTDASMVMQAEYYLAANAYELRQDDAQKQIDAHLLQHPYTPYFDRSHYMLGILDYEAKRYKQAIGHFRLLNEMHLNDHEKVDYLFARGYANLETDNTPKALEIFKTLKALNTKYNAQAQYYTGYSQYKLGNYDEALPDLLAVEAHPEFADAAPYYVTQIYYAKQNYPEVDKRTAMLLQKYPNNPNNAEIYRIAGERAFANADYKAAASNFKNYEKLSKKMIREDSYMLGLSYMKTGNPNDAIKYLASATSEKDEITENAYLQLGNAYVQTNLKPNARLAYEAALRTSYNKNVREEALYNYALTTYETTTAFGESIKAFEQFLNEFPNSKHREKAYDYLSDVYLTSRNYRAAYQSIIKFENPTPKLKEARQYIEYQLGTESFIAGNYQHAMSFFNMALQTYPQGKYASDAYFWRGESNYRLRNFSAATDDFRNYLNQPGIENNPNYKQGLYSLGYAYFGQKKYTDAMSWFIKYLNTEKNTNSTTYSDAMNRVGDGYFFQRNFSQANQYYDKAAAISSAGGDYGLFQSAYVDGLQKDYQQKISKLEQLLTKFPKSNYTDDALYEMARAYILLDNDAKTVETYSRLISNYPNSILAPKAMLEIGMVYFNNKNYDQAIPEFKKVVSTYPASEEANTALESLETIYIEKNDVETYLRYAESLGKNIGNTSLARQDSISFTAAEKQYMTAKYPAAITGLNGYVNRFCPSGKFCNSALYYLADSYDRTNDKNNALTTYVKILNTQGSPYMEQASLRAAGISFDKKEYQNAMTYFKKLEDFAQSAENKNIAKLGVLRTSYFLNNIEETINIANSILADNAATESMRTEALLNRSKAYTAQNKLNEAYNDLKQIKIDTKTAIGAEAKFLLTETLYKLNKLNEAEKEALDFAKKNTPHQYWLARSFIVLADVYIKKGEDFQAKQYLLSLQKNYTVKNDVQDMITERLNAINERSK